MFLPRTYHTETRLIAQRNAVMSVRADANWDTLRGVSETVLSHDNIVAMVRQTDLVKNWNMRRPPLTRLKDAIAKVFRGEQSEEVQVQSMAWMVADRLHMSIGDGQVSIVVDWPEPQMAAKLVETAQQNCLEERNDAESQSLAELLSIDESHARDMLDRVRQVADQIKSGRDQKLAQIDAAARASASAQPSSPSPALPIRRIGLRPRVTD